MSSNESYLIAYKEITDGVAYDEGIWAKAYSEADGDEKKAIAEYIKIRVADLDKRKAKSISWSQWSIFEFFLLVVYFVSIKNLYSFDEENLVSIVGFFLGASIVIFPIGALLGVLICFACSRMSIAMKSHMRSFMVIGTFVVTLFSASGLDWATATIFNKSSGKTLDDVPVLKQHYDSNPSEIRNPAQLTLDLAKELPSLLADPSFAEFHREVREANRDFYEKAFGSSFFIMLIGGSFVIMFLMPSFFDKKKIHPVS